MQAPNHSIEGTPCRLHRQVTPHVRRYKFIDHEGMKNCVVGKNIVMY